MTRGINENTVAENPKERMTVRLESGMHSALNRSAEANSRSLEAEARFAIRQHLANEGTLDARKDSRLAEVERTVEAIEGLEMKLASLAKRADYFTDAASLMADFNTRIVDQRVALYALDPTHPRAICEALL